MLIKDTVALVTGSNRGIGHALVLALLAAGVRKVYAVGRTAERRGDFGADPRVAFETADIANQFHIAALASRAGDVALLFNNAGVLDLGDILSASLDQLTRSFDVNFHGTLAMARAFAPAIERNGGGAIVNLLSLVALASMPGLSVYNASKAAAWSMTQSLRASLAGRGIAVHGVFPGAVDTDMIAGFDMPKAGAGDVAKAIVDGVEGNMEDIFPDPMSTQLYDAWRRDHKAVERQFATM